MSEYRINICPKDKINPIFGFNVMFLKCYTLMRSLQTTRHKTRDVHVLNSPANVNEF